MIIAEAFCWGMAAGGCIATLGALIGGRFILVIQRDHDRR